MRRTIVLSTYLLGSGLALWVSAGSTQAKEVPVPQELAAKFKKLDADRDQRLSPSEFPYGKEVFLRGDLNKDGHLSLREAFLLHAREKTRKELRKGAPKLEQKFRQLDKNGDGVIQRSEFPAPEALFKKFDRNGDGQVSWEEGLAFAVEEEVGKIFAKHDQDLSGDLSVDEVKQEGVLIFVSADANQDGKVTGKELYDLIYAARHEALKGSRQGAPQAAPQAGASGKKKKKVDLHKLFGALMKHDADKNGSLSRREFPGSSELFARIDLDRDGALDPAELRLRARLGQQLIARGERIKASAKQGLKRDPQLALMGLEIKGLFESGRYEEVSRLMDETELRLARARK